MSVGLIAAPDIALDREPLTKPEIELVNGFSLVPDLIEIWQRERAPKPGDHCGTVNIWLVFGRMEVQSRELADRIEEEYRIRRFHDPEIWYFWHARAVLGRVPPGLPVRLWRRAIVVVPA